MKADFNRHVTFREKRPGVVQVLAPIYHDDGDMTDIFIDLAKAPGEPIRISDHGLTLMRLSYDYDMETPTRRKVLDRILLENGIQLSANLGLSRKRIPELTRARSLSEIEFLERRINRLRTAHSL